MDLGRGMTALIVVVAFLIALAGIGILVYLAYWLVQTLVALTHMKG